MLVTCSYRALLLLCLAGLELLVPNLLPSDVKLFITCIISCALFPRERNSVRKEFVYLILFFKCTANLSFPFEEK